MRKFRKSTRLAPAWAMILLLIVWGVFFYIILIERQWPGVPIFVVMGYMILCGLFNRLTSVITPGYLQIGTGPLPAGGGSTRATRAEVLRWYVRLVVVPSRYGVTRFHCAGVELKGGKWIDVLAPYKTREEAFAAAGTASAVFTDGGAPLSVDEVSGIPPTRNWRGAAVVLAWGGAVIGALVAGIWMELHRS
jgi:hypothetical protein